MSIIQPVQKFNNFKGVSRIPYFIVSELLWNNEDIWKLLYYTAPVNDPLSQPNLTAEQKHSLIYNGKGEENHYRVFFTTFPKQKQFTLQSQQIRIYRVRSMPNDSEISNVSWAFELPCHEDIDTITIDNGQTLVNRTDLLTELLFDILNGAEIGGIGVLQFNNDSSNNFNDALDFVSFGKQFNGFAFTMSCNFAGSSSTAKCNGE